MSEETTYKLKFSATADVDGIDQMDRGVRQLSGNVEQLARMLDKMVSSGMGAEKVNLDNLLKAAPMLKDAWDLGTKIGETIGDAITRVGERGFSLRALLGKYDARFDESIQRWREGMREALAELGKEPPPTLLDYLEKVGAAAQAAADKLEHLAKLQKMEEDERREIEDELTSKEKKAIQDDPNLTPEQKDEEMAKVDKAKLYTDAERRDADRLAKETAALDKEELARSTTAKTQAAVDEQQGRVKTAAQFDEDLQYEWSRSGNTGKFSNSEAGQSWAEKNREAAGIGSFDAESKRLAKMQGELAEAKQKEEEARTRREQLQEVNTQESAIDWARTNRRMADIDDDLAKRQHDRRMAEPPAGTGGSDPAVAGAAESAGQAIQQGSGAAASEMQQLSRVASTSFDKLNNAISMTLDAVKQVSAKADQALKKAEEAAKSAGRGRESFKSYNRDS